MCTIASKILRRSYDIKDSSVKYLTFLKEEKLNIRILTDDYCITLTRLRN